MSKLEKPSAVEHLDAIVALSDAVMVARGDLGVEMPPEQVPPVQRQIVRACRHAGKPSIVATQMLESMIQVPTPTRAEASDVASAIYHGADAVMLSAESASGQVSAGSGDDDGPHHQGRGERSRLLPADERCGSSRARRDDSGRDLRQHAAGHRPAADRRRRHLHELRVEQPARLPRAAGYLDPQHGRERWNGTTPDAGLGHPFGRGARDQHPGRDERLCVRDRAQRGLRQRRATPSSSLPAPRSGSREQRTCSRF